MIIFCTGLLFLIIPKLKENRTECLTKIIQQSYHSNLLTTIQGHNSDLTQAALFFSTFLSLITSTYNGKYNVPFTDPPNIFFSLAFLSSLPNKA